ncbi:zinc-binding dehydrogenase [Altererythrobacter sp. MF3-039]|uniref:zinc-binding dehydrogenase n=1 Tax=Altererythrobacter sp. MF3-039 TaxID=3252901 RepID=UPI00390C5556
MVDSYRAIEQFRFADSFAEATRIVELPITDPGPGEIRVRNRWCGINGIFDTQCARNLVDFVKLSPPFYTGVEAVGEVEAIGPGVTGIAVGDAVASTRFGNGYREIALGPVESFVNITRADSSHLALASSGVAAWLGLTHTGELKSGEVLAISAAAGGLGHLDVQIGKALGCHVVAICGGPQKAEFVRSLGADRVIDYRSEDVAQVLAAEYPDRIDVALDTVGGPIFDAFIDNLATHGRCVISGWASDMEGEPQQVTSPRIGHKLYYKGASVHAFMNGLLTELWPAAREAVLELHRQGKISVAIDDHGMRGIDAVPELVERLGAGESMGKVALEF